MLTTEQKRCSVSGNIFNCEMNEEKIIKAVSAYIGFYSRPTPAQTDLPYQKEYACIIIIIYK